MKILIQALFLLFLTIHCYSQDDRWILYYSDSIVNVNYYIDKQTISYVDSKVYVWEKIVAHGFFDLHGFMDYNLYRIEIDCNKMSYRMLISITYYTDGKSLKDELPGPTYFAEPDSFREKTLNFVCK
jgi:hypothetical protein